MKRRNADIGKFRRPIKRTKISEGMYGNSLLYLKFVMLWALVVLADHMLEFRFEFLWPFWMMLRSVYDSFKYQGLAFSVFFITIALTSDMICFFFIPVQWVFFAASTYVWVQYVWYTDRGICLPTVVLCALLVYVEAAVRSGRDSTRIPGLSQGQLDLCRPFAAHCVGYPVVTLGFGVKSYVSHRMRLRRQKEVQAENQFYYQLLRQALPETSVTTEQESSSKDASEKSIPIADPIESDHKHMNGHIHTKTKKQESKERKHEANGTCLIDDQTNKQLHKHNNHPVRERDLNKVNHMHSNGHIVTGVVTTAAVGDDTNRLIEEDRRKCEEVVTSTNVERSKGNSKTTTKERARETEREKQQQLQTESKKETTREPVLKEERKRNGASSSGSRNNKENKESNRDKDIVEVQKPCVDIVKEQQVQSAKETQSTKEINAIKEAREREKEREKELQKELKSLTEELRKSRSNECDLRKALSVAQQTERQMKHDHTQLKQSHEQLQTKVSSLWARGSSLERRLGEEKRVRQQLENQIRQIHHRNKSGECGGAWCRQSRSAAEIELASLRTQLQQAVDSAHMTQKQAHLENGTSNEEINELRERAANLERTLSAETRIKMDLFSALGTANRHLHIREELIRGKEREIEELKGQIAQMLAVMPDRSPPSYASATCSDA